MPTIADCPCPGDLISVGIRSMFSKTLDQWYGPHYRYIKVRSANGNLCILRIDEHHPALPAIGTVDAISA